MTLRNSAAAVRQALSSLRPYQEDLKAKVYGAWDQGHENVLAVLPTGGGKCLGKDTPILMFDGSIKLVQDVAVGDKLMGPDSKPRIVLNTCTGREMLYTVTPVKGDPYIVNESHILSLKRRVTYKAVNLSVKDYLRMPRYWKESHRGWRVPGVLSQDLRPVLTGIKVEAVGEGDYYGFEITGDRLFMLGDFTVTHNTVILSHIVYEHNGASAVLAHRRELITQISIALARNGVKHRIMAPNNVIKEIVRKHVDELGLSFYDPSNKVGVASVDTLAARMAKASTTDRTWANNITLWIQDEAHHVLKANKWGKAIEHFPNAKGLGVTATPCRADGKGLGRHADGVFDVLVEGPTMRWLINEGYLTDYRVICPPTDLDLSDVSVTASGDYNQQGAANAVKRSHIIGDVVENYLKFCAGKRGVTFVPDVETASDQAMRLRQAGIAAEALSAKSPDKLREEGVRRLASGSLLQLVNVDLFGEGFDLPAIDVVQFARPTMSYSLYAQQFGRVLRPVYAPGYDLSTREGRLSAIANGPKPIATIIDHVGNLVRHEGPPDKVRVWTLDRRDKRSSGPRDSVPIRVCLNVMCMSPYERFEPVCPYCGTPPPPPAERSGPEFVDGDLFELSAEALAKLRGEEIDTDAAAEEIRWNVINAHTPAIAQEKQVANGLDNQVAQRRLRGLMDQWSGWQAANGLDTLSKRYKKFYFTFGLDVSSAKALKRADAEALATKINQHMGIEDERLSSSN